MIDEVAFLVDSSAVVVDSMAIDSVDDEVASVVDIELAEDVFELELGYVSESVSFELLIFV